MQTMKDVDSWRACIGEITARASFPWKWESEHPKRPNRTRPRQKLSRRRWKMPGWVLRICRQKISLEPVRFDSFSELINDRLSNAPPSERERHLCMFTFQKYESPATDRIDASIVSWRRKGYRQGSMDGIWYALVQIRSDIAAVVLEV